jgi:hypothetical protein
MYNQYFSNKGERVACLSHCQHKVSTHKHFPTKTVRQKPSKHAFFSSYRDFIQYGRSSSASAAIDPSTPLSRQSHLLLDFQTLLLCLCLRNTSLGAFRRLRRLRLLPLSTSPLLLLLVVGVVERTLLFCSFLKAQSSLARLFAKLLGTHVSTKSPPALSLPAHLILYSFFLSAMMPRILYSWSGSKSQLSEWTLAGFFGALPFDLLIGFAWPFLTTRPDLTEVDGRDCCWVPFLPDFLAGFWSAEGRLLVAFGAVACPLWGMAFALVAVGLVLAIVAVVLLLRW